MNPKEAEQRNKRVTCYYWYWQGNCTKADDRCAFAHYDTGRIADPPRFIDNTASIKKTGPSKSRDSIPDGMSVKLQKAVLDLSRREERISRKEHDLEDRERRLSAHEMELRGRQSIDEQGLAARSLDMDEKEMCIAQLQQDTSDAAAAMKDRESALRRKENNQGTMHPDRAALNNLQAANQAFSEELDVRHSLIEARELTQRISEQRHAKAPVEVEIVVKLLDILKQTRKAATNARRTLRRRRDEIIPGGHQVTDEHLTFTAVTKSIDGAIGAVAGFDLDLDGIEKQVKDIPLPPATQMALHNMQDYTL